MQLARFGEAPKGPHSPLLLSFLFLYQLTINNYCNAISPPACGRCHCGGLPVLSSDLCLQVTRHFLRLKAGATDVSTNPIATILTWAGEAMRWTEA